MTESPTRIRRGHRPTLARRLLVWYALAVVVLLLVLGVVINERTGDLLIEELTNLLKEEAEVVRFSLEQSPSIREDTVALGDRIETRITVIAADGTVLADSRSDPAEMENHGTRPEVIAALAGELGVDSRLSETVGVSFRYVALPVADGLIYRLSVPLTEVEESLSRLRFSIVGSALLMSLIGVATVWLVAARISRPLGEITDAVSQIADGDASGRLPAPRLAESARLAQSVERMAGELQRKVADAEDARSLRDDVLSALPEALVLIDAGGSVVYANQPAKALFGAPAGVSGLAPSSAKRAAESALATARTQQDEFTAGVPPQVYAVTVLPLEKGRMVLLVARDMTESKRVESMRRDFVADASHELKTPVAAIRAGAETILRAVDDDPAAVTRFAEQIDRIAIRLGRLVSDLLDLSRLEGELPIVELVRLDRLIEDEVAAIRSDADRRQIELILRLDGVEALANADDLRLGFRNLLDNALRYTPAGGTVRIAARREGGEAVLEVRDSGIGIPSRDLPRIFERFYRVDAARSRETGGTGLGLAIVKHVTERHGGSVEVASELGRGSTFTIRLPLPDLA
ncbi:MAG: ATP-binding protein [Acidimicrobiia bacterium]|nr:ATP-binding protein [Acidimicrobiia bacterium]